MTDVYNHARCAQCGGHCCKKFPGATIPEDWGAPDREMMLVRLAEGLRSRKWVIAIAAGFIYPMPLLLASGCVFLKADGCVMSDTERPYSCRTLQPSAHFPSGCTFKEPIAVVAARWKSYQDLMHEAEHASRVPIRKAKGIWGRAVL